MRSRLRLDMTAIDAVTAMAEGNPGAIAALCECLKLGSEIDPDDLFGGLGSIMTLDTLGIYGSRLYMLWNDVCRRDMPKFIACLRAYQLGQLAGCTESALNHAIDNRGNGLDVDAVLVAVCERLGKFKPVL